jgi:hypothetical protein
VQALDVDVGLRPREIDFSKLSNEDLETLVAIYEKAVPVQG